MSRSSSLLQVCHDEHPRPARPAERSLIRLIHGQDYRTIREKGFLKIEQLLPDADIREVSSHMDDVMQGLDTAPGFPQFEGSMTAAERAAAFNRIHNAHRVHPLHERFLLHPRILDVVEQLNGPDVLALQSMMFFKQPGQAGQGYHQDAYYIPTLPNTLIAAWVAVTEANEENGCLWFRVGSQNEPIYPQADNGYTHAARALRDAFDNMTSSVDDIKRNQLAKVAERYPEVSCPAKPGDVIFFFGNILHRSLANKGSSPRRAFAGHYCDARSFVPWNMGDVWEEMDQGKEANRYHILARGDTNLGFSKPRFGTPCAAIEERKPRVTGSRVVMPMGVNGKMDTQTVDITQGHDD